MANFAIKRKWLCIVECAFLVNLLPECVSGQRNNIQENGKADFSLQEYSAKPSSAVIKPVGVSPGKAELLSGSENFNVTLELLIICDANFSALFNFEENLIKEYLHIYLYDVTLRFHTVSTAYISILITDIIIFTDIKNQSFIEEARSADGIVYMDKSLLLFQEWTFSKMTSPGKFDLAVTFLNAPQYPSKMFEIATRRGACQFNRKDRRYLGSSIIIDDGTFQVNRGARALARLLGAHYDEDDYPLGCPSRYQGFIMSDNFSLQLRYFFSICSSRSIGDFVRNRDAICLRRIDNESSSFEKYKAPTKVEQCIRSLKIQNAFIQSSEAVMSTCTHIDCYWIDSKGILRIHTIYPVDNTPCGNSGYCLRGRCLPERVYLKNTGSALCMQTSNRLSSRVSLSMKNCSSDAVATPTQMFYFKPTDGGYIISSPYSHVKEEGADNSDKCFITYYPEGNFVYALKCNNEENPDEIWDLEYVDYGRAFLLRHRRTTKCAKQSGNSVVSTFECDNNDPFMIWRIVFDEN